MAGGRQSDFERWIAVIAVAPRGQGLNLTEESYER
jgi:hypothetical protein